LARRAIHGGRGSDSPDGPPSPPSAEVQGITSVSGSLVAVERMVGEVLRWGAHKDGMARVRWDRDLLRIRPGVWRVLSRFFLPPLSLRRAAPLYGTHCSRPFSSPPGHPFCGGGLLPSPEIPVRSRGVYEAATGILFGLPRVRSLSG
jgi:hypothetical protein